ncbi:transcription antitermination protein NusB [Gammaproteobacteria bacterium]
MAGRRTRTRQAAVQALYQWQITHQPVDEIVGQFAGEQGDLLDLPMFRELLTGVLEHWQSLDDQLAVFLDRPILQVDLVERAILRLGAFELVHRQEVPYRVVINEAVEAAKCFGAEQGHRYVNGVLDKLARRVRTASGGIK